MQFLGLIILVMTVYAIKSEEMKYLSVDDVPDCSAIADRNECIRTILNNFFVRYKDGNKLLNIPPLDPFTINRTSFEDHGGPIKGKLTLLTGRILGLSDLDFKSVQFDASKPEKVKLIIKMFTKSLTIEGSYEGEANFNNVELKPKGNFKLELSNVALDLKGAGAIVEKDNHKFLSLKHSTLVPTFDDLKMDFTGLFEDEEINKQLVLFVNENWRNGYPFVIPILSTYWNPLILQIASEALRFAPLDQLIKL